MLRVHSFETFGTHEGPGIRFVVFLQGCKFRCLYCHNPDTQPLDGGKMYSIDEIVEMAERVRPYFGKRGGVTISGGEPLLQSKELIPLFQELKKRGIHAVIDTNGHPWDESVQELVRDYTDLVLLDIKEINPERHEKLVLVPNDNTLRFASWLREIKKPTWIRYVLVPGYSDFEEDLEEFGRRMGEYENIECVDILPYHTLGTYKYKELGIPYGLVGVEQPTNEEVLKVKNILEKYFKKVVVR